MLRLRGVDVQKDTVHKAARASGLKSYVEQQKPLLTGSQRQRRLEFAEKYKNFDWRTVLFCDETTFHVMGHGGRRRFWAESRDQVPIRPRVKHPQKLHAWCGFAYNGKTELFCFTGNMNADFFLGILDKRLLKDAQAIFGNEPWTLLQDSDPKHTAKKVQRWLEENVDFIPPDDWPGNSPDINCIENLLSTWKRRVYARNPRDLDELQLAMEREWKAIPATQLHNLVDSMDDRLTAVCDNRGGSTDY
jgi:hypothetical protein